jgi:hypothetical protein
MGTEQTGKKQLSRSATQEEENVRRIIIDFLRVISKGNCIKSETDAI